MHVCVSMYRMCVRLCMFKAIWMLDIRMCFFCVYMSRVSFWTALALVKVCLSVAQVVSLKLSAPSPLLLPTRDSSEVSVHT